MKKCCFLGHRFIFHKDVIRGRLQKAIHDAIDEGYDYFLVGTHGKFDAMALSALKTFREHYPINICVILTSMNAIVKRDGYSKADSYSDVQTKIYDIEMLHFKTLITHSNKCMVSECDKVITYVDEKRHQSGAKTAFHYAKKQNKQIVNIF